MVAISLLDDNVLTYVMEYFLNKSKKYKVFFPRGESSKENPLMNQKDIFSNISRQTKKWNGMENGECLIGYLDYDSVNVFKNAENSDEKIWKFNLYDEKQLLFSVDDFDTGVIYNKEDFEKFPEFVKRQMIEI